MVTHVILTATEGSLKGQEFDFPEQMQVLIGRSRDCSLRLADDPTISRRHCLVSIDKHTAWVRDLESMNGTFVNRALVGHRPPDGEENLPLELRCLLHDGDELRIGGHAFRVGVMVADPTEDSRELSEACA
jgi:pSer/pThr/pTyr-binding forkhead associated (FHA) protein